MGSVSTVVSEGKGSGLRNVVAMALYFELTRALNSSVLIVSAVVDAKSVVTAVKQAALCTTTCHIVQEDIA